MTLRRGPRLPDGRQPLFAWAESHTGERGRFGVTAPPGEYVVRASVPWSAQPTSSAMAGVIWAPTFFPGTLDESAAETVTVVADHTAADIVVRLVSVPAHRISGVVVDESGVGVGGITLVLEEGPDVPTYWVSTKGPGYVANIGQTMSDQQGRFLMSGVGTGSYVLTARSRGLPDEHVVNVTVETDDLADVRVVVGRRR